MALGGESERKGSDRVGPIPVRGVLDGPCAVAAPVLLGLEVAMDLALQYDRKIVVEGDPLRDLRALEKVRAVMKAGTWYHRIAG